MNQNKSSILEMHKDFSIRTDLWPHVSRDRDSKMTYDFKDLRQQHDLPTIVGRYLELRGSGGGWLMGRCPFHEDGTPSLGVSRTSGSWRCFGCGRKGTVLDFISYLRFDKPLDACARDEIDQVVAELGSPVAVPVPAPRPAATATRPTMLEGPAQLALHLAARLYHTTLLASGNDAKSPLVYLRSRGFSDRTIRQQGLGYATGGMLASVLRSEGVGIEAGQRAQLLDAETGRKEFFAGRIVFIDLDRSGRVLHMIGRRFAAWLDDDSMKYLALRGASKPLYGYARLDRRASQKPVIVVESPPDRLTAVQAGIDAVAVCGTALSEEQAEQLRRLRRPLIYVPHNDESGTGYDAAVRWQATVGKGEIVRLPEGVKDLNAFEQDAGLSRWLRRLKSRV